MRILITGAKGQLGQDCLPVLQAGNHVFGVDLPEFDLTSRSSVRAVLQRVRPDVIVNCAAYTDVDRAESDTKAAWAVNAEGVALLARAAAHSGARLIHISTDYVLDGRRERPGAYTEEDRPAPASVYGKSKLAGEQAVLDMLPESVVLRTAWLYGAVGGNFLKKILRRSLNNPRQALRVVNDQYGSPTWSHRLAIQVAALLKEGHGLYHAAGEGGCTWFELARCFLDALGIDHPLVPCTSGEYPTPARRPANSALLNGRLKAEGLNRMRPWDVDVREFAGRLGRRLLAEAGQQSADSR